MQSIPTIQSKWYRITLSAQSFAHNSLQPCTYKGRKTCVNPNTASPNRPFMCSLIVPAHRVYMHRIGDQLKPPIEIRRIEFAGLRRLCTCSHSVPVLERSRCALPWVRETAKMAAKDPHVRRLPAANRGITEQSLREFEIEHRCWFASAAVFSITN